MTSSVPVDDACAICLGLLADGTARVTLGCIHRFHMACLAPHANAAAGASCPLCRGNDPALALLVRLPPARVRGYGGNAPTFAEPDDAADASEASTPRLRRQMMASRMDYNIECNFK
jgi:hypothetical protein